MTRRAFGKIAGAAAALPLAADAQTRKSESGNPHIALERQEMDAENIKQAIEQTVASLEQGISKIHGRNVNPRESGYIYHPRLLQRYARGFKIPLDLPQAELVARIRSSFADRTKIYPVSESDMEMLGRDTEESSFTATKIRTLGRDMEIGEVAGVIYLSANRDFQRLYPIKKTAKGKLQVLESYPDSTSKAEPAVPSARRGSSTTPLGIFIIPKDGVRPALPGEVTKVERPDITRYYFEPETIEGKVRYFVKDVNRTSDNEIVTVVGDTHLVWSPEFEQYGIQGIKIHDTTELDEIGTSVSSGCIRTPSVRRFTMLTASNKHPTKILIHWARRSEGEKHGWGGFFDVKTDKPERPVIPRRGNKK